MKKEKEILIKDIVVYSYDMSNVFYNTSDKKCVFSVRTDRYGSKYHSWATGENISEDKFKELMNNYTIKNK